MQKIQFFLKNKIPLHAKDTFSYKVVFSAKDIFIQAKDTFFIPKIVKDTFLKQEIHFFWFLPYKR